MAATIRDIREKTGLSLATISKYLNGGNVLPENKVLIDAAVEELHYEVNEIARGLVKNKTKTVGVMVYNIASFFSANMLHYIGNELRKQGYGMMICDSCNDEQQEAENLKFLLSRKVDGIIVLPVSMSGAFLQPAEQAGIPIVLLDRTIEDERYDSVCIDNRAAAMRAMDIFFEHNHSKIAMIGSDVEDTGIERMQGYKEALQKAGVGIRDDYIKTGRFDVQEGYTKMKQLLTMEERPTAVLLCNYETALGGVMAINESDLSFPEDISLIGFDDLLVSNVVRPNLWLVVQPMESMCLNAVRILLERINKERTEEPMRLSFGAKILQGESVRELERTVSSKTNES